MGGELSHTVNGSSVQTVRAMRLRLESNADMFDRAGDDRIGDTGKGAREIVLRVGKLGVERIFRCI